MKRISQLAALFALWLTVGFASAQVALIANVQATVDYPTTIGPINTTGASAIIVSEVWDEAQTTPTDNCGNTYPATPQLTSSQGGWLSVALYIVFAPKTCTAHTFSIGKPSAGGGLMFSAAAFSGIAGLDQSAIGNQSYGLGPITPTASGELIFSAAVGNGGATGPATVPGMTMLLPEGFNDGQNYQSSAYSVQTTPAPVNVTWVPTPSGATFAGILASFFSTAAPAQLSVTSTSLPEAFVGKPYSYQLAAAGGVAPYTWTSLGLAVDVTMSSSGLISGTYKAMDESAPVFTVADSQGHTATTPALTLAVAATSPTISTTSCPTGTQYSAYPGCQISATGGTAPLTYGWCGNPPWTAALAPPAGCSNAYQALPEGLSINQTTGSITGTLHGMGPYTVQMTATDAAGAVATQLITFEIAGSNSAGTCSFPSDSIYYQNVSALPVDTSPLAPIYAPYLSSQINVGFGDVPFGIPFMVVPSTQPMVPVESNAGSALTSMPFPFDAPMEGTRNSPPSPPLSKYNGDNHVLVQQLAGNGVTCGEWDLYQVYPNYPNAGNNSWGDGTEDGQPGQYSAHWDMSTYNLLPDDQGGVTAGGLPVIPFLENADEVIGTGTPSAPNGVIHEPKRFTLEHTANRHVWPATAQAGNDPVCTGGYSDPAGGGLMSQSQPPNTCTGVTGPMGEVYRLKANVSTPACAATSPQSAVIITGFRNYGIILDDNGETGAVIGTNDSRWNNADLACLHSLTLADFEPVNTQSVALNWPNSSQVLSAANPTPVTTSTNPTNPVTPTTAIPATIQFNVTCTVASPITCTPVVPAQ